MRYVPFFSLGVIGALFLPRLGIDWSFPFSFLILVFLFGSFRFVQARYLLALFLGAFYSVFSVENALMSQVNEGHQSLSHVPLTIEVVSQGEASSYAHYFIGRVLDKKSSYRRLSFSDYKKRFWPPGSRWQIIANLHAPIGRVNQVGLSREAQALNKHIDGYGVITDRSFLGDHFSWLAWFEKQRIAALKRISHYQIPYPSGSALVASLAVGYRGNLEEDDWRSFRALGLSHLISISGLHVAVVAGLIAFVLNVFLRFILSWRQSVFYSRNLRVWVIGASLLGAALYALFSGFSIPTQRSLIMMVIVGFCMISRRYFSPWRIFSVALFFILLYDPFSPLSPGFWLSFTLVGSLLLVPYVKGQGFWGYLSNLLRAEWAATIAGIVPVALFFHYEPLGGFIANCLGVPWFSLVLTPLSLVSLWLPFDWVLHFTVYLSELTLKTMHFISPFFPGLKMPAFPGYFVLLAIIAVFILVVPRGFYLKPWAMVVLLSFIFYAPARPGAGETAVHILDVGQGLAVLIQTRDKNLLFDTGPPTARQTLLQSLYARGVNSLDVLVLSHHDIDHDGNWRDLQAALPIKHILAGQPASYPNSLRAEACVAGGAWKWSGVHFEWLTPFKETDKVKDNDKSCVLRVIFHGHALLLTGDLSQEGEKILVQRYNQRLSSQVLVLGHHGSSSASNINFIEAVSPRYAIASVGYVNPYHHPHNRVMALLGKKNIFLKRTDYQGELGVQFGRQQIAWEQPPRVPYWQKKPFLKGHKVQSR